MPIFMKVTPKTGTPISGGGVFPKHRDWMLLESFNFGNGPPGGDMVKLDASPTAPKPSTPEDMFGTSLTIKRIVDLASPDLLNWLSEGDQRVVEIDHCTQEGENMFSLKLDKATLTDYYVDNQDANGIPENLTIFWEGFELTTAEIGPDGVPVPS